MREKASLIKLKKALNAPAAVQENLSDFLLVEMYTPTVLACAKEQWKTLPFYVTESLDPAIVELIHNPPAQVQSALNRYWIERAVNVLRGYADCPVPFARDTRGRGPRYDLLSEKGRARLQILEYAVSTNAATNKLATLARSAAQKADLDLDLFVDLSYMDAIAQHDVTVTMSSGCDNGCVHCGFEARAPVSHMPYPVFLKLTQHCTTKRWDHTCYIYSDSDPITYQDPIINADAGDAVRALVDVLDFPKIIRIPFLTKGVLTKRDEIAFGKVVHHQKLIDRCFYFGVGLSFVDLPGEAVDKNIARIKRTVQIYRDITGKNPPVKHLHLPGTTQVREETLSLVKAAPGQLRPISSDTDIVPVGRWDTASKQLKIKRKQNPDARSSEREFSEDGYIVGSNLMIYDVYLHTEKGANKYVWQPLCSVFDRAFVERLKNPKQTHPTLVRAANAPTVIKNRQTPDNTRQG